MASTHSPNEALLYAKVMTKYGRLDDSDIKFQVLDEVNKEIWYAAPWSWTVGEIGVVTLSTSVINYSIAAPSDFEYIYRAYLVDAKNVKKPLKIDPILPADPVKAGETLAINYSAASGATSAQLRIFPRPAISGVANDQKLIIFYKKTAPEIVSANHLSAGAHLLPDRWWHVYKAGVLARGYLYADDDRSFQAKINGRNKDVEFGGYEAKYRFLIDEMKLREPMPSEWETYQENIADNR